MKRLAFFGVLVGLAAAPQAQAATALGTQLSGRILLQTERHGESWYVHPKTKTRHFLYRAEQAYQIMREEGVGISNANLEKIPVGYYRLDGPDADGDGLVDNMEKAIGTDLNKKDTDGDGVSDADELKRGMNPKGSGNALVDKVLTQKNLGVIFLQVEKHGEGWWVNPVDGKRYYLGGPSDAYALMRAFGLGITNANLAKIPVTTKLMDCFRDTHCMTAALELDQLSLVDWQVKEEILDLAVEATSRLQLSRAGQDYALDAMVVSGSITIPENVREKYLQEGSTEEELAEIEALYKVMVNEMTKISSRCTFANKEKTLSYLRLLRDNKVKGTHDSPSGLSRVSNIDTGEDLGQCVTTTF